MNNSQDFVSRMVATPQEVLLNKLAGLKVQIRTGVIASILIVLICGIGTAVDYRASKNAANLAAESYNMIYAQDGTDDGYVVVNDQLSIQLSVRRVGENDWHPHATVASWHETVELRVLTKVVVSAECESYSYVMSVGSSYGLTGIERYGDHDIICKTHEPGKTTYIQEGIYRGQVTAKGWWGGYSIEQIGCFLDEDLVTALVVPDFGYIKKSNIFVTLSMLVLTLCVTGFGVINYGVTLHKLRSLE